MPAPLRRTGKKNPRRGEDFIKWMDGGLRDAALPDIAEVYTPLYWKGVKY